MNRRLVIDCDPGQDDAVMLLLAFADHEEIDVLGITTVAGNVDIQQTQRNARIICDLANKRSCPVFAGHEAPLERKLVTAENIHGLTGIEGVEIFEPQTPLQNQHAVDFIAESFSNPALKTTLVATGPLTNIAAAFAQDKTIADNIDEIVIMGGAMREAGNITPSAEFNIFVDPEAADVVFDSGCPITVVSLDITHQALVTADFLARLKQLPCVPNKAIASMLELSNPFKKDKFGESFGPLHDPCTIAYLLNPDLFKGKHCSVKIETGSELTRGHTAVDFWGVTEGRKNCNWLYEIDADGFYDLLIEKLALYLQA